MPLAGGPPPLEAVRAVAEEVIGANVHLERVTTGTSTPVYRLSDERRVAYLRLGEHRDHRLDVEVAAHERLRAIGVRLPEVLAFEPFHARLERPVMVLAALPGASLADAPLSPTEAAAVYRDAGRDLARLASVAVGGFGFVDRDGPVSWPPRAPHATAAAALLDGWNAAAVEALMGPSADPPRVTMLREVRSWAASQLGEDIPAWLAHGDVDPSHVFHQHGRYTGLIDLGELQGGPAGSDLARVLLWLDDEVALPGLTAGFDELAPPGAPNGRSSALVELASLQGLHHLARWWRRDGADLFTRPVAVRLAGRVGALADTLADAGGRMRMP